MAEQIKINPAEIITPASEQKSVEQISIRSTEVATPTTEATPATAPTPTADSNSVPATPTVDPQRIADIERILEEDLGDMYFKLAPADKEKFRLGGEEAARQINTLLSAVSVQFKKVVDVIRNWLKLIPGVNTYFLEQEAKIKADRLLKLNQRR